MRSVLAWTALIALLVMAGGCGPEAPVTESLQLQTGYWQARITLPGGHIDTAFEVGGGPGNYRATLINGQERI